jgi:glycerol uptake facilitator-like aquaporin
LGFEDVSEDKTHYARSMTDEQLRSAWLILFGSGTVPFIKIVEDKDKDNIEIARECYKRGLAERGYGTEYDCAMYKLKSWK